MEVFNLLQTVVIVRSCRIQDFSDTSSTSVVELNVIVINTNYKLIISDLLNTEHRFARKVVFVTQLLYVEPVIIALNFVFKSDKSQFSIIFVFASFLLSKSNAELILSIYFNCIQELWLTRVCITVNYLDFDEVENFHLPVGFKQEKEILSLTIEWYNFCDLSLSRNSLYHGIIIK